MSGMVEESKLARVASPSPGPYRQRPRWALLGAAVVGMLSFGSEVEGQRGRLVGTVVDSGGQPVGGATIIVAALHIQIASDDSGVFVLTGLPLGPLDINVRRLGYEPQNVAVTITSMIDSVSVRMVNHAIALSGVSVTGQRQRMNIEAFYERVRRGMGSYVTRSDILTRKPLSTTDMFRTVPGIRIQRLRGTDGIRFNSSSSMRRDCPPMLWIDGQRAPGLELGEIPPGDVEGIELYNGPSTTPMQFSHGPAGSTCGVVVVWTRPPPPRR